MAKASDNAFPSILITEGTEPSPPAAGKQRLYIDSTTHKLKRTDSSGTDVDIESTSATLSYIRNRVINGNFRINQRAYVSAASLASGAYGFDRWKATTASTTLTYTAAPQGQSVTINSGGSIGQKIERANVEAGSYVLSWAGTATGRAYNAGGSVPSYAASPVTVSLDGTDDVMVEFQASGATKTLSLVQLEIGSTATAFEREPIQQELARCQRHFVRYTSPTGATQMNFGMGVAESATAGQIPLTFPVPMRATPAIATSGTISVTDWYTAARTATGLTVNASGSVPWGVAGHVGGVTLDTTVASGQTAGRPISIQCTSAGSYVEFSADL